MKAFIIRITSALSVLLFLMSCKPAKDSSDILPERVVSIIYHNNSADTAQDNYYTYDTNHRIKEVYQRIDNLKKEFTYDNTDQLTTITIFKNDSLYSELQFRYTQKEITQNIINRSSDTSGPNQIIYTLNDSGDITAIKISDKQLMQFKYDKAGNITEEIKRIIRYNNDTLFLSVTREYDSFHSPLRNINTPDVLFFWQSTVNNITKEYMTESHGQSRSECLAIHKYEYNASGYPTRETGEDANTKKEIFANYYYYLKR